VVIEKHSSQLDSARELNARILRTLHEDQIFRIDHFLGKTRSKALRIPVRKRVVSSRSGAATGSITCRLPGGDRGVERRGKFYEVTGALRDWSQPCVLAALAGGHGTAGWLRRRFDPHQEGRCLAAMPAIKPERAVRGHMGPARCSARREAYRTEPDVASDSNVEPMRYEVEIDNWRWAGVPFYIRTGKHLSQRRTEIAICFKQAPYAAFPGHARRHSAAQLAVADHRAG